MRFSIRSFGSWGEAAGWETQQRHNNGFSIRSFGSWGEAGAGDRHARVRGAVSVSALSDRGVRRTGRPACHAATLWFQYPLFRIVG